jgi:hypothetical protein
MAEGNANRVEVVRGRVGGEVSEAIMGFWNEGGMLTPEDARARLAEVVCILRTPDGGIAGVNSAFPYRVPIIGNRTFWIYRSALGSRAGPEDFQPLLGACFDTLAGEFSGETDPVGVCLMASDAALMERHPEAVWPESGFLYAGYQADGWQVRIRYFDEARI